MPEHIYALRYHLRCAADRAVESAVADAEERPDAFSEPGAMAGTVWVGLVDVLVVSREPANKERLAHYLEGCAGLLLRAAVWLRRSR